MANNCITKQHHSWHSSQPWEVTVLQFSLLASTSSISSEINDSSNYMAFWITRFLWTLSSDFPLLPSNILVKHKTRWNSVPVGCRGKTKAPGGADVFVSAAICSADMSCIASCACELCSPGTAHPHGHFILLCCTPFIWPLRLASLGYCNCDGSAANRFDCTQLQRKELDFHCLELDLISMGDSVYIFMLLC